jgi:transglutaminase-like putative cysteine protease
MQEEDRQYLASTAFIQSDHPDITKKARAIVGSETDRVEMVRAIYEWVYRKVKKEPTVSMPSALDVLRNMEGDCNEHTYLFVALARAVGIPAKVTVGFLYTNGAFYYHAWPAVYVGQWWELDPTIGQEAVDATHVAILEGETADQLKLLGLIGQLNAEVLKQQYR